MRLLSLCSFPEIGLKRRRVLKWPSKATGRKWLERIIKNPTPSFKGNGNRDLEESYNCQASSSPASLPELPMWNPTRRAPFDSKQWEPLTVSGEGLRKETKKWGSLCPLPATPAWKQLALLTLLPLQHWLCHTLEKFWWLWVVWDKLWFFFFFAKLSVLGLCNHFSSIGNCQCCISFLSPLPWVLKDSWKGVLMMCSWGCVKNPPDLFHSTWEVT